MSYDLHFFKLNPGQTFEETLEVYKDSKGSLLQPIDARHIADSITAMNFGLVEYPKNYSEIALNMSMTVAQAEAKFPEIEFNTKELEHVPVRLLIGPTMATASLPIWDYSPTTVEAIRTYFDAFVPVLFVNGLVGYDPQVEAKFGDKSFDLMMRSIANSSGKTHSQKPPPAKPKWKFW